MQASSSGHAPTFYAPTMASFKQNFSLSDSLTCRTQLNNATLVIDKRHYKVTVSKNTTINVSNVSLNSEGSSRSGKIRTGFTDNCNRITKILNKKKTQHEQHIHPINYPNAEGSGLRYFDVTIPYPPRFQNIEDAKRALRDLYDQQMEEIRELSIPPQLELKQASLLRGSLRERFEADLTLLLEKSSESLRPECENVQIAFETAWINMHRLAVYRLWSIQTPSELNPLPFYPGCGDINSEKGQSAIEAELCSFLFSGVLNYDIFRPLDSQDALSKSTADVTKVDQQKAWRTFYHDMLWNEDSSHLVEIPAVIRSTFHRFTDTSDSVDFSRASNTKKVSLFEGSIPHYTKPLPSGTDAQQLTTLRQYIESDWRCCSLTLGGSEHVINLVLKKDGSIQSLNNHTKTQHIHLNNKEELYQLFVDQNSSYQQQIRCLISSECRTVDKTASGFADSVPLTLLKPSDLQFIA